MFCMHLDKKNAENYFCWSKDHDPLWFLSVFGFWQTNNMPKCCQWHLSHKEAVIRLFCKNMLELSRRQFPWNPIYLDTFYLCPRIHHLFFVSFSIRFWFFLWRKNKFSFIFLYLQHLYLCLIWRCRQRRRKQ